MWSIVLLQVFLCYHVVMGGYEPVPHLNIMKYGKVTLEQIEAEMPAPVPMAMNKPGPTSDTTKPDEATPLPDVDTAYFPSPDDDGTYVRVDMSEDPGMTFHYNDLNHGPLVMAITMKGFSFGPKSVKPKDVSYFLFTKKTDSKGIEMFNDKPNKEGVEGFWVHGGKVKILCHGFQSSAFKPYPQLMKNSYMKLDEDLNVILVDWSSLASSYLYFSVAKETTGVGQQVAALIGSMIKEGLTTLDKVHFIGHSLGAHVGGATGFALQQNLKVGTLSRITGLDPAGPGFCDGSIGQLQTSDAHFVDVIHTDDSSYCDGKMAWVWNRAKGKWGSDATSGHANFFPNGGHMQPGCGTGVTDTCSHSRAYYYMEESYNDTSGSTIFKGCPCTSYHDYLSGDCLCSSENYVIMGEYTPVINKTTGQYFLKTGGNYPYSRMLE